MTSRQEKMFSNTAAIYDAKADAYAAASRRELRELTLKPSLIKYLCELYKTKKTPIRVLDIGCGTGESSRLAFSCGAREVTGIDISKKEIAIAKKINRGINGHRGIDYSVKNAFVDLGSYFGAKFDFVIAILSVHYCPDKNMLERFFSNVKKVLRPNGKFLAVVVPFAEYEGYGVKISSSTGREGESLTVSLSDFQDNKFLEFDNIHWSEKTYQEVLEKIGFSVEWLPCFVSDEGIEKYGKGFWQKFLNDPIYKIFIAK